MKICLMTSIFDPFDSGVGKHVTMLAEELSKKHDVIVISALGKRKTAQNGTKPNQKIIETSHKNINSSYHLVSTSSSVIDRSINILWRCLNIWNPIAYLKIKKILDREKPDIVHTHTIKRFSPSVFSAIKNSEIPHVHTLHDYELISPWFNLFRNGKAISKFHLLDRVYIWYKMITSPGIDAVISPSKFTMNFHTKLGFFKNSKKYVISHGLILYYEQTPKKDRGKEFLFVGRIVEYKGPHIAVNAFKKIKNTDARLHIVGRGSFLDALKQIAYGDERIIFHGFVSNDELEQIFKKCSYMIVPSIFYEIFGFTIIEAMNYGLPVIGSNFGAIPEIINDGYNGHLFEAGNIDSLCLILEDLLSGKIPLSELSKNAIESTKRFSIEDQVKGILSVYHEISYTHDN